MKETDIVVEGDGDNVVDENGWAEVEEDEDEIENEGQDTGDREDGEEKSEDGDEDGDEDYNDLSEEDENGKDGHEINTEYQYQAIEEMKRKIVKMEMHITMMMTTILMETKMANEMKLKVRKRAKTKMWMIRLMK